jgi:hypothetical protein
MRKRGIEGKRAEVMRLNADTTDVAKPRTGIAACFVPLAIFHTLPFKPNEKLVGQPDAAKRHQYKMIMPCRGRAR